LGLEHSLLLPVAHETLDAVPYFSDDERDSAHCLDAANLPLNSL